jgi:cyanosortase A-associated protein
MKSVNTLYWQRYVRPAWLIFMIALTASALIKAVFFHEAPKTQNKVFAAPTRIDLSPYKFIQSENIQQGKMYQYESNKVKYNVELRYFSQTQGDITKYLSKFKDIKISTQELDKSIVKSNNTYYSLTKINKKAYLNACINPNGGSTVSVRQFKYNRTVHDITLERFVPWLLGRVKLKDERCLWANLSTPIISNNTDLAYRNLEGIWNVLYKWAILNFPNP